VREKAEGNCLSNESNGGGEGRNDCCDVVVVPSLGVGSWREGSRRFLKTVLDGRLSRSSAYRFARVGRPCHKMGGGERGGLGLTLRARLRGSGFPGRKFPGRGEV
jgi:hypothetical protein